MKKSYLIYLVIILQFFATHNAPKYPQQATEFNVFSRDEDHEEETDGPRERDSLEFEKIKDPSLGYAPVEKLLSAVRYTENLKNSAMSRANSLTWVARGPIFDSVGPTNGNLRGGFSYTSGYMTAVFIDTLHDPTGNTVFCGGTTGGIWKCTNFLSSNPNWVSINDSYLTLNIASICQDPSNPNTMYFSTGNGVYNVIDMYGSGIWKSTDGGNNWTKLPATSNLNRSFKIVCDAVGNVYVSQRTATTPVSQTFGLFRSKDQGITWENITPTVTNSTDATCTDIEISSTGRLHASFGFGATRVSHWYTDDPANVTPAVGWNASTGIRTIPTPPTARRLEIACIGNILYGITVNAADNADSCYKSIDGGATWTKQNTTAYPAGVLNGQGFYDITLAINPQNTDEFLVGGLDAYKSINSGLTANTRMTFWVTGSPANTYVHADHHFMQWWMVGAESRIVIGGDGGLFLSRNGGTTFEDRNKNLNLKQFYAGDIHPDAGSPYLLAGAQDNGSHQLRNPGLSYSYEVTGGDGCFTHINQVNPSIQFCTYVFNQYRRSTNGGQTWSNFNFSTTGLFVNPYDYDDGQNILYGCNAANSIRRWANANTSGNSEVITSATFSGTPTAFKVSPYTSNTVFIATTSSTRIFRLENANTVTSGTIAANLTNITGASFPTAFLNCINVGSSDQHLVAVFTNFGINNIWYSNNGGTSWIAIDGDLPDMPVRWAVFHPSDNNKMYIATATGVYSTEAINGASTVWVPESGFPTVRTDMLKVRLSDNTLMATTYGRGLYTAVIPGNPEVRFNAPALSVQEVTENTSGCKYYKDYNINVSMVAPPTGDATVTYTIQGGNTANPGLDFDFTTNGNFSSSSNQHVFVNGVAETKTLAIRVYDDAQIEPSESLTLSFVVSGATNAVAGAANKFTLTITDDDHAPTGPGLLTATVGENNVSLSQPFRSEFSDSRTQIVYLASELTAAGFTAGNVNAVAFQVVTKVSGSNPFNNFTVKLKNTTTATLTGGPFEGGATTVFGPVAYVTSLGVNTLTLTSPFMWDGVSNLLVDICYDNVSPTSAVGMNDLVTGTNGGNACHFTRENVNPGCSLPNALTVFTGGPKPVIILTIDNLGTPIASGLNTSRAEHLGSSSDLYFYSATGEILARIQSQLPFDYGCTPITIDRAGTGATAFWNNNLANRLMDKTFNIVPAINNPTGLYQITLYYSQAEKEGWEAATGQSWNSIQLIKVAGQINQVTPGNPSGGGTVEIVTPTRGTFGPHFTLTFTFNSGFSGFGAGIAGFALPVGLLDFTGRLQNNSVVLNWKTSFELNSKGFDIERSYDGQNFQKIGYVTAAGNSSLIVNYQFSDKSISQENNYYRLKQRDLDEKFEYSKVVLIKNPLRDKVEFKVMKNPFTSSIDIQFTKVPEGNIQVRLFDATGKSVMSWNFKNVSYNRIRLDVAGKPLASGIYMLNVRTNKREFMERVMKE